MDSSDLKILRMLLLDARAPLSRIAKALGISMPAVQKRIERLKNKGVIVGSRIIINDSMIGWKRAIVALNASKAGYAGLLAQITKLPLVTGISQVTGPYSILVELQGPSGVINAVIAHIRKMHGISDCCAISIAERVV